jgi:GAF domain-containing protein
LIRPVVSDILRTIQMSNATVIGSKTLVRIMHAIHAVETGKYTPDILKDISTTNDEMGQLALMLDRMARSVSFRDNQLRLLRKVIPIGLALSAEKDFNRLLETLVVEAQSVTHADAGTLYLLEDDVLKFVILRNVSLDLAMGGTSGNPISFYPVKLYNDDGSENRSNIASYVALTHKRVTIADAYTADGFDFSGTKSFDEKTKYRSKSFITVPLENVDGKVIGVLQLINAKEPETGEVVPFSEDDVLEALVLLATAALDGYIREASLRQEIAKLKIEIDVTRRERQVQEITETAYFRELKDKATLLRNRKKE